MAGSTLALKAGRYPKEGERVDEGDRRLLSGIWYLGLKDRIAAQRRELSIPQNDPETRMIAEYSPRAGNRIPSLDGSAGRRASAGVCVDDRQAALGKINRRSVRCRQSYAGNTQTDQVCSFSVVLRGHRISNTDRYLSISCSHFSSHMFIPACSAARSKSRWRKCSSQMNWRKAVV